MEVGVWLKIWRMRREEVCRELREAEGRSTHSEAVQKLFEGDVDCVRRFGLLYL